jgi:polyphosphate kinase
MENLPYFDRELSWLSFNQRVLQEAADPNVPIIERIRFLGIYSSNLHEFFRVRVASVRRKSLVAMAQNLTDNPWQEALDAIIEKVKLLTDEFTQIAAAAFEELAKHHIHMVFNDEHNQAFEQLLSSYQKQWLSHYFDQQILPHITPIFVNNKTQLANCLEDECVYLFVALHHNNETQYALVEVPRQEIERFIVLPMQDSRRKKFIVMLDDVIYYYLDKIFTGFVPFERIEAYSVELLRDAEYNLTDELDRSLLEKLSKSLKQRLTADPVRLSYDHQMPLEMKKFLYKAVKIQQPDEMMPGVKYRHFNDFIKFPNLGRKTLENKPLKQLVSQPFKQHVSVFDAISAQDILLYYPYYQFRHFIEFVRQAAYDPQVEQIKINIYRVAKHSLILNSLIDAVKNGKQVTVVVELRARFDEQANIKWATRMKDAGIHVEFGIETLKVHAKLCLVTRNEAGKLVRYAHIGTGNFHENNAQVYTDFALFTRELEITKEVEHVFSFIAHSYKRFRFDQLMVAPLNARRRILQLIDFEISQAQKGKTAKILFKVNNLADEKIIKRLYSASQAGVQVRLIVRSVCCLIPDIPGVSDKIEVISIVDQFLEHPRVFYFHHQGEQKLYISSSDLMARNLDNRVEVGCPVHHPQLKQRILTILNLQWKDNVKARVINREQTNAYRYRGNRRRIRSQMAIYDYLSEQETGA